MSISGVANLNYYGTIIVTVCLLAILHWRYPICGNTDCQKLEDLQNILQQGIERESKLDLYMESCTELNY